MCIRAPSSTRAFEIGPFTVIGEGVRIGKDTRINSHVVVDKWTTIGAGCDLFQFVSIGAPPQDLGYKGEKTEVIIGDNNVIREFVTIHRATTKESRKTHLRLEQPLHELRPHSA